MAGNGKCHLQNFKECKREESPPPIVSRTWVGGDWLRGGRTVDEYHHDAINITTAEMDCSAGAYLVGRFGKSTLIETDVRFRISRQRLLVDVQHALQVDNGLLNSDPALTTKLSPNADS